MTKTNANERMSAERLTFKEWLALAGLAILAGLVLGEIRNQIVAYQEQTQLHRVYER